MEDARRIPWSVRVVAYLIVGSGLLAILRLFLGLYLGRPVMTWVEPFIGPDNGWIDLFIGLLKIHIGASLLERSRFWRFVVLAWLACTFVARIIVWTAGLFLLPSVAKISVGIKPLLSWEYGYSSPEGVVLGVVLIALHLLWVGLIWWALDRPDVRKLFIKSKSSVPSVSPSPV